MPLLTSEKLETFSLDFLCFLYKMKKEAYKDNKDQVIEEIIQYLASKELINIENYPQIKLTPSALNMCQASCRDRLSSSYNEIPD